MTTSYIPTYSLWHIQTYLVKNEVNNIKKNLWSRAILQAFILFKKKFSFCCNKGKVDILSFKTTYLECRFDQKSLASNFNISPLLHRFLDKLYKNSAWHVNDYIYVGFIYTFWVSLSSNSSIPRYLKRHCNL